jgi:iron complex outermembrane recepter protein
MSKQLFHFLITSIIGLMFVFGNVICIYAQEAKSDEFTLEEITVTAQKRVENSQKVSVQMETLEGDKLIENGMSRIDEVLENVAAATVQKQGQELNVTIRGMDNDARPGDSSSMVGISVDGAYTNLNNTGLSGFYDMKRVEVLSGPQGTLYSRNSAGGVINMITNNPSTEGFDYSFSVELGNYHLQNLSGMINVPVNNKTAVRAAFQNLVHDGYLSNDTDDNNIRSGRVKLSYNPSENLSTIFGLEFSEQRGHGAAAGADPWETPPANPWYSSTPSNLYKKMRNNYKVYMDLEWSTPIGDLTFLPVGAWLQVPGWNETERRSVKINGVYNWALGYHSDSQHEYSGELRLASPKDFFMKWLIGLYYYDRYWHAGGKALGFTTTANPPFVENEISDYNYKNQDNKNKAIFANITLPVFSTFRVTLGGRYTTDDEQIDQWDATPNIPGTPVWQSNSYPSRHFDYKLNMEYDLGENTMLWADYSTGYKHVLANQASQTLGAYQLGSKSRFFNKKLQVNATAWYYKYNNFDARTMKLYYVNGVEYTDQGTGLSDAILYGLDFTSNYLLTANDRINFSLSKLHSEIADLTIKYLYYYPPEKVLNGHPLNNAPAYSMTASYEHVFYLSNGGNIQATLNTRYETKKTIAFLPIATEWPGFNVDALNLQPAHHISGLSVNYMEPNGKWTINFNMKNIENYPEKVGVDAKQFRVGEPRTFGVVFSLKY